MEKTLIKVLNIIIIVKSIYTYYVYLFNNILFYRIKNNILIICIYIYKVYL